MGDRGVEPKIILTGVPDVAGVPDGDKVTGAYESSSTYFFLPAFLLLTSSAAFTTTIPEDELIIVRLGNEKGLQTNKSPHSDDFFVYIDETYKILAQ